jgi:hypothetical protein
MPNLFDTFEYQLSTLANAYDGGGNLSTIYVPIDPLNPQVNTLRIKAMADNLKIPSSRLNKILHEHQLDLPLHHTAKGIGLFLWPDHSEKVQLPRPVPGLFQKGPSFLISPLIMHRNSLKDFYFLQVDRNSPHLYKASLLSIEKVELPASLEGQLHEKMNMDELGNTLQFHSSNRSPNKQIAKFHGHSDHMKNSENELLTKFYRKLEKAVLDVLPTKVHPIILCGSEEAVSKFRHTAKKMNVNRVESVANLPAESIEKIHQKLMPLIEVKIKEEIYKLNAEIKSNTEQNLEEIASKSLQGSIDKLFVDEQHIYSLLDEGSLNIEYLEKAARNTMLKGGSVIPAVTSSLKPIAAVQRYA